ncbi:Glycosyl transferase (Fragment) OS=Streptomyces microflavus OX=1919 GN=G3I39_06495 PE=4 SV=1 [Streptomyces microflavus]
MALSVRLFGPQLLGDPGPSGPDGVATAAVLNTAVRRRFGPVAGLIAVGVFALTPVAALMFRFNNPDALLALLMTVTVWCVLRALEQGRTKWLLWRRPGWFAFLTKTLQAFLILPPLAVLYAVCASVPVRKRLGQLALLPRPLRLSSPVAGGWRSWS